MRIPKRGQKGFTLIELLIVVAILGVLSAVVIPNVGRFLGRGETEARKAEYHNVASAVMAMMTDNNISTIPNAITSSANATNALDAFPDTTSDWSDTDKLTDPTGVTYATGDKAGYLLYGHDRTATGHDQTALVNYVSMKTTKYFYTCDIDGTIHQYDVAGGTEYQN